jgi:hypothetical protein
MQNLDKLIEKQDWFSLLNKINQGCILSDDQLLLIIKTCPTQYLRMILTSIPLSQNIMEDMLSKDFLTCVIITTQKIPNNLLIKYDKLISKHLRLLLKWQTLSEEYIESKLSIIKDNSLIMELLQSQRMSENFIKKHEECFGESYIGLLITTQRLSIEYITDLNKRYNLIIWPDDKLGIKFNIETNLSNCWQYKSADEKLEIIKKTNLYEIKGDYVIAYKSIRKNGYSNYNFQYKYEVDSYYTTKADYNILNTASFGFSAWTLKHVLTKYYNWHENKIIKIKIHKSEIAALVHNDNKIRSTALYVINEIKYPILLHIFNSIINIFKRKKWQ